MLGYVRAEHTDGINLCHVRPVNAKLALDHTLGASNNGVELQLVGSKDQVSQVHNGSEPRKNPSDHSGMKM